MINSRLTVPGPTVLAGLAALALLAGCAAPLPAPALPTEPPPQAVADCLPLLRALRVAREQLQVAQYRVDTSALPVRDRPASYRIGDLLHETEGGVLLLRQLAPGEDPLVDTLQAELARGRAWCHVEPDERYQGLLVSRILFRHPQLAAHHHPTTVLVDRASGRPLWHGYASMDGGYAWVYGAEPPLLPPPSTLGAAPQAAQHAARPTTSPPSASAR